MLLEFFSTTARGNEIDQTASRTVAEAEKVGETRRTGAGREADTRREIGNETGSVTETVKERQTGIVVATEKKSTHQGSGLASHSIMSLS